MRTTLDLDDALLRRAKKTAAERGSTLTRVIEEALREHLVLPRPSGKAYRLKLLTRKAGMAPGVDIADRDAVYHRMEEEDSR
jgi:predicted transcriptional regulator